VADGQSTPEVGLAAARGHGGLPQRHGRQEGGTGTLVVGSPWADRRRGGLAAVGSEARSRRSVCEALGRGGEERGARMSTVELAGGVAPLLWGLREREVEDRRVVSQRPLMAPISA
jgi:hypothetical protein